MCPGSWPFPCLSLPHSWTESPGHGGGSAQCSELCRSSARWFQLSSSPHPSFPELLLQVTLQAHPAHRAACSPSYSTHPLHTIPQPCWLMLLLGGGASLTAPLTHTPQGHGLVQSTLLILESAAEAKSEATHSCSFWYCGRVVKEPDWQLGRKQVSFHW